MPEEPDEQVFRYAPAWQKWALAFAIMVGFTWYHLGAGYGSWVTERDAGFLGPAYIAMTVFFICALGALPAITLFLLADRGHVTLTEERVSWRTWWDEKSLQWDAIHAVGEPAEEKGWAWLRRFWFDRNSTIRLITDEGWVDIPSGLLSEGGDEAFQAIASTGGLPESFEHDGRTFRCRPGWTPDDLPASHPWRRVKA